MAVFPWIAWNTLNKNQKRKSSVFTYVTVNRSWWKTSSATSRVAFRNANLEKFYTANRLGTQLSLTKVWCGILQVYEFAFLIFFYHVLQEKTLVSELRVEGHLPTNHPLQKSYCPSCTHGNNEHEHFRWTIHVNPWTLPDLSFFGGNVVITTILFQLGWIGQENTISGAQATTSLNIWMTGLAVLIRINGS